MIRKKFNQLEFSEVFYDTLFGLILFFNLDSFLSIRDPIHLALYILSLIIVVHWWLFFTSVDDVFGDEVVDSSVDIVFGVIYIVFLEYMVLMTQSFNYTAATIFLLALFAIDVIWALIYQYVGKWSTKDNDRIVLMEYELSQTIITSTTMLSLFGLLFIFSSALTPILYVLIFGIFYLFYIHLTYKQKIIDIEIF